MNQVKRVLQTSLEELLRIWKILQHNMHQVRKSVSVFIRLWLTQSKSVFRHNSLKAQMASIAIAVTVATIVIFAIVSSLVVGNAFSNYLESQLNNTAQLDAARIGGVFSMNGGNIGDAMNSILGPGYPAERASYANERIWVMLNINTTEKPVFTWPKDSLLNNEDYNVIQPNLLRAINDGTTSSGALPDATASWLHYSARAYAIAPIISQQLGQNVIIGSVAVTSEKTLNGTSGPSFIAGVNRYIIITGVFVAIIMGIIAAILSTRITRPLNELSHGVQRVASGDLTARVYFRQGKSSTEIEQLATVFNSMAVTLEHDVNELKHREELERALLANVAHELATPMTAIRGFSDLMLDGIISTPEDQVQSLRTINKESIRVQSLIDTLSQLARLEAGFEHMEMDAVNLHSLTKETIHVLSIKANPRKIVLVNEISQDFPVIHGDVNHLTQVLLNLIDNAIRYTPDQGTVTIRGRLDGKFAWVDVIDTGPGIPEEELQHVFLRFYRLDPARNKKAGGSGLGLSIVHGIVESHGGIVRASNMPDGGACFSFNIPLEQPHENSLLVGV